MDSTFSYSLSALRMCTSLITSLMRLIREDLKKLTSEKGHRTLGELHLILGGDTWSLVVGCGKSHFTDVEAEDQTSPIPPESGREILMLGLVRWLQNKCFPLYEKKRSFPRGLSQVCGGV